MSENETVEAASTMTNNYGWRHIYALYHDPPEHCYQAIEIVERAETGTLLIKAYGGRRGEGWLELVIPREDRDRLADAIHTESEATQ